MALYKKQLNTLEKHIASQIHKSSLKASKLLFAVSGGRDSMTLLHSMNQIASDFQLQFYIAHFHHGQKDMDSKTLNFRDKALNLIQKQCENDNNPLHFEVYEGEPLKSENDLRSARWLFLKKTCYEIGCKAIVTAHHKNDLLETRILRLIRGVGHQGLKAMTVFDGQIFRPLLEITQQQLFQTYTEKINYIEDPSNQSPLALRNWLRHQWLPILEKKSPGAIKALSRSLDILSKENSQIPFKKEAYIDAQGIKRQDFEKLPINQKNQIIAHYLYEKKLSNYTTSHILEIQKRLQTPQKNYEFWLLKYKWIINPKYIKLQEGY